MFNFDTYVMHLSFVAILGDQKFGTIHVGLYTILFLPATLD